MSTPRPVVIANPHAGQKGGLTTNAATPHDVHGVLARHGLVADLWPTQRPDHATDLARQAAREGRPLAIAAGGDGTVAEVAAGLIGSGTKLGVMPLGSVMNLARMLGVPRDLDQAAEVLRADFSLRIDAGRATTAIGERIFLEAAGVGVSAALFAYTNQLDSGNWGSLRPLLRYLLRYQPRTVRVAVDGQRKFVRATMVTVANGPLLGAGLTLAPDARLDDRQFDVRIFTAWSKAQLATQVWAILRNRTAQQRGIITLRGRHVEIHGRRPLMVHADSHPLGTTPARFELLPAALEVVVPEHPACEPALVEVAGRGRAGR